MLHFFKMEKSNINYSTRNIPQPSKHECKVQLKSKVESVIKRMRWKTLEFCGKLNTAQKETFDFVSCNYPPSVNKISGFKDALTLLIKNIEFRSVKNKFQSLLNEDIKRINSTEIFNSRR